MKIHLEYLRLSLKQIYDIILKLDVYILKKNYKLSLDHNLLQTCKVLQKYCFVSTFFINL